MRSTFEVKTTGLYPRVHANAAKVTAVGQAGGILQTETIRAAGLDRALSEMLSRWRKLLARHDPGKIILDLAISLVLGGDALSDIAALRCEPTVYGPVASDPTVSRLIAVLAEDADKAVTAISTARQQARARVWNLAGNHAPDHGRSVADPVIIDLDATLITAVSTPRSNIGCGEGFELLPRGVEAKGCSRAVVGFICDRVEVGLIAGDVGPLGQVLGCRGDFGQRS